MYDDKEVNRDIYIIVYEPIEVEDNINEEDMFGYNT